MNKLKKKVLGILGAIAVAVMTLVAYAIPTNAAEDITSITHEIIVSVYDKYPEINIKSIENDEVYLEDILNLEYDYINAKRIEFELINSEGTVIESWVDDLGYFDPTTVPTGTLNHELDFTFAGFDEYTLHFIAYGGADTLTYEDSYTIKHYAVQVVYIGDNADNDPVFDIYYRKEADQVEFDIFDQSGRPLFDPAFIYPSALPDSRYYLIDPTGAF